MRALMIGIAATLVAGAAVAQTAGTSPTAQTPSTATPPAATSAPGSNAAGGNNNQAVATTHANAATPAKGKNSFTMAQARKRLESNGFTNISGLAKDNDGVWRGHGQKSGNPTDVWLDYKGNVGPQ